MCDFFFASQGLKKLVHYTTQLKNQYTYLVLITIIFQCESAFFVQISEAPVQFSLSEQLFLHLLLSDKCATSLVVGTRPILNEQIFWGGCSRIPISEGKDNSNLGGEIAMPMDITSCIFNKVERALRKRHWSQIRHIKWVPDRKIFGSERKKAS